jgi:hypothetical protein
MKFDTYFYINNNTKDFYLDNINTIEHFSKVDLEGPQGNIGNRGYSGSQGLQGLQGRRGIRGNQGIKGDPGIQGYRGSSGYDGPKGEKGNKGIKGPNGLQGFVGPRGKYGPRGESGPPGNKGVNGLIGRQGYSGIKGPPGDNGNDGEKLPTFGKRCVNKAMNAKYKDKDKDKIYDLQYDECNILTIDNCLDNKDCIISEGAHIYNYGTINMTGFGTKIQPMLGQTINPKDKRFTAPYDYKQNSNKQMKCPPNSYLSAFGYSKKGTPGDDWCKGPKCERGRNERGELIGSASNQWNNMRPGMPYVYASDCTKLL